MDNTELLLDIHSSLPGEKVSYPVKRVGEFEFLKQVSYNGFHVRIVYIFEERPVGRIAQVVAVVQGKLVQPRLSVSGGWLRG